MFLADETSAYRHPKLGVVQSGDALIQVPLAVDTAHHATVVVNIKIALQIRCPIKTLTSVHCLQGHTLGGTQHHSGSAQSIIHAKRPLFVGAEDEAAAKLVVDVTHGHADETVVVGGEEIGQTNAVQLTAEVSVIDFTETVDTEFLAVEVGDANALVKHIILRIGLETAVHMTVLKERLRTRSETDCQGECEDE